MSGCRSLTSGDQPHPSEGARLIASASKQPQNASGIRSLLCLRLCLCLKTHKCAGKASVFWPTPHHRTQHPALRLIR